MGLMGDERMGRRDDGICRWRRLVRAVEAVSGADWGDGM